MALWKVLTGLAALPLGVFLFLFGRPWLNCRRRARLRQQALPDHLHDILVRNVGIYAMLPDVLRSELQGHINVFLAEKQFVGCAGIEVTDEMRVTVAGLACLLQMNRDASYFPGFSSILIYPDAYVASETYFDGHVEVTEDSVRAGESWDSGPVVLSWNDVLKGAMTTSDGYNVVLHEFAHKLDEENNGTNGQPLLHDRAQYSVWASVLSKEFESLQDRVTRGECQVLHEYGLTSPAEFFAVATESFFEKPLAMREQLPDLYEQLRAYYRIDPATWLSA